MDESKYFRERIPSESTSRLPSPGRRPEPELHSGLPAFDGPDRSLDIGRACGHGEFEVTQALFQLVQAGFVVVSAPTPAGPAAIVAIFNEAIAAIFQGADARARRGEVREQLGAFATGAASTTRFSQGRARRATGRSTRRGSSERRRSAAPNPRRCSRSGSTSTSRSRCSTRARSSRKEDEQRSCRARSASASVLAPEDSISENPRWHAQHWLIKSEPNTYPSTSSSRTASTRWDGVRNFKARNNLRAMKEGRPRLLLPLEHRQGNRGRRDASSARPTPTRRPRAKTGRPSTSRPVSR